MRRKTLLRARLPIVAAASATALVVGLVASTANAAPSASSGTTAKALKADTHKLSAKGLTGKPKGLNIGSSLPAGVPAKGKYAFLLKLSTTSTMSTYNATKSAHGKSAAQAASKAQLARVTAAQDSVISTLPSNTRVLYKMHSVMSAVAVVTDVHNYNALTRLSGVTGVYPIAPKSLDNSYAVPLQGAPQVWTSYGDLGQNSTIAVIDTGIDYTHANFGGAGTVSAYQTALANDTAPAPAGVFPNSKIIGGFDFAGDSYQADPNSPNYQPVPQPDPNPLDCNSHGSHVAGTAAGFGVTSGGATFFGPYNNSTPFGALRIGPGMAPYARIYSYKVFGCQGSSNVVGEAIDAATDPNGDGDPSDHANVINMSLGSDFGSPQDGDSVSSNMASQLGISVVVASGNGGDYYDIGGSPGNAVDAIAVANSVDAQSVLDAVHVSSPAGIAGSYGAERSIAYDWTSNPDLSGTLVAMTQSTNKDGCDPLNTADAAAVAGKIAFLEWTDDSTARRCGSVARSANIVAAGGAGAVFADDEESFAAGITGSATIPVVIVTKSAGDAMRANLAGPVVISGTTANGFTQTLSQNDDTLNSSSSRGVRGAGNVKPDVTAVGTSVFSTGMGTGNQGLNDTGTSMATPMVAGLSALIRTAHPDWTPEEVKADIMNTAGQDLFTGTSHTGDIYAPNRVGSGRIQAKSALDNNVLAFVVDDPGAVSVSFGPVAVTGPLTMTKTVKVSNKNIDPVSFNIGYDAIDTIPGVTYNISPSTLTISGRSSKTFTVQLSIPNPSALTKTIDSTMDTTQAAVPREFVADASGRVLLTPTGGSSVQLRVPVYSAPRPASTMTNPSSVLMPTGSVQVAHVPLTGTGVNQGSGSENVTSTLAGFELQAASGVAPTCSVTVTQLCVDFADERSADLKYVGATSDAFQQTTIGHDPLSDGLMYFAISTQGSWRTPAASQEYDIYIDTNGDGVPDAVLFNTRYKGQDVFVTELVDLNTGDVVDVEPINNRFGDQDTALYDSDTLVMPVSIGALSGFDGFNLTHSRIHYGVLSFSAESSGPIDDIGLNLNTGNLSSPLTFDALHPAVAVYGTFNSATNLLLYQDSPGTTIVVRKDVASYALDHGLGAMIVHFQNTGGQKVKLFAMKSAPQISIKLAPTSITKGQKFTVTFTVANTAGVVPTGKIGLRHIGGTIWATGTLKNGTVSITLTATSTGTFQLRGEYGGDANYNSGVSGTVVLKVS